MMANDVRSETTNWGQVAIAATAQNFASGLAFGSFSYAVNDYQSICFGPLD